MSDLGLVTNAGRILRAQLLAGQDVGALSWCAIGSGNWGDIENPPLETTEATGLANEYGRKRIQRFAYLEQDDDDGVISWNGHFYAEVLDPTPITAFFTTFQEAEAVGANIAELGIFGGNVITASSPFALAANVVAPGVLYWIQHRPLFIKTVRDTYEVIAIFEER